MSRVDRPPFAPVFIALVALVAAALLPTSCSNDQSDGFQCPEGHVETRPGRCAPAGEETGDSAPPDTDDQDVTGADSSDDPDAGPSTTIPGGQCTPGDFIRCDDRRNARVCGEDGGVAGERVPCDGETPTCLASAGGCSDLRCDANQRYCDGDNAWQCNGDGTDATLVESCPLGCGGGSCLDACAEAAGKDSYLGCEFIAVWMDQADQIPTARREMAISLANAGETEVMVTINDGSGALVSELSVPARDVVRLPVDVRSDARTGPRIGRTSWRIRSTGPITAHQFNPPDNQNQFSNDASLLLPVHSLGTDHMILTWPSYRWGIGIVSDNNRAMMAIAAAFPDTTVIVEASTNLASGPEVPAIGAGDEQTFLLGEGQVLYLHTPVNSTSSGFDPSGTRIISDRPVAVFAGHQCAFVPDSVPWCDHLEQQMVPTDGWRARHVGAQFSKRGGEDTVYRVLALRSGTGVRTFPMVEGIDGQTLTAGQVAEFRTDQDFLLEADAPVAMGQFMVGSDDGCQENQFGETVGCLIPRQPSCTEDGGIGDPAFLLSVPVDQFLDEYVFLVPNQYREDHITVIHREGTTVNLNGSPLTGEPTAIQGTHWVVRRQAIVPGVHSIEGSAAFGLHVYGYDCAVSYAYPGGMGLDQTRPVP